MGGVPSFVEEREVIFLRWLAEVEALLGCHLDYDAAFEAWAEGYTAAEFAAEVAAGARA